GGPRLARPYTARRPRGRADRRSDRGRAARPATFRRGLTKDEGPRTKVRRLVLGLWSLVFGRGGRGRGSTHRPPPPESCPAARVGAGHQRDRLRRPGRAAAGRAPAETASPP